MAAKLSGGGKKDKFDLGQNAEINVTPFVDVLLVLLIIFMVAVPLATVSIKLDLPPATPPPPGAKVEEPTVVNVQQSGLLFIGEAPTTLARLSGDLTTKFNTANTPQDDRRVFIRADADVTYGDFMAVMNDLQSHGYYQVALINEDIS